MLVGEVPPGLIPLLTNQVYANGYGLLYGPADGEEYGITKHDLRLVQITDGMPQAQTASTLCHELAHVMLHSVGMWVDADVEPEAQVEFEAQAVAHLVLAAAGVDTSSFTVPYIADWAAGSWPMEPVDPALHTRRIMADSRNRVLDAALTIIASADDERMAA
jgi:hypothetical protein